MPYSITEFEHIYTGNFARCMRMATSLLNNEDDARDVVHDVFIRLWESENKIDNPDAFVVRAVRNGCLDRIKVTSARERIRQNLPLEPIATEDETNHRQDEVRQAIATVLTPREREIVDKIYADGLSYKATAESLSVSVSMVNKTLVNAMKRLRNHFKTNR